MQRVFFVGAMHEVDADPSLDTVTLLNRTGGNTGNMLIGNSVFRHLAPDQWSRNMRRPPEEIKELYDVVVIPASNFLHSGSDLGHVADFLEKVDLPCVMIGVGSQAPHYDAKIEVGEGTQRFFKVVSERSVSIGVRGEFTASWIEKFGIKNIEMIGCPSLFWTCNPSISISKKPFSEVKKIALNGSRNVISHSSDPQKMRKVESALLRQVIEYDASFFVQNEHQEAILARKKEGEVKDSLTDPILKYYGANGSSDKIRSFFINHSKIYFDIPEWASEISSYDFSIGTRFHGNMIAVQNGVPAVIIVHDSRTKELCELLHFPYLSINDIDRVSLQYLYELCDMSSITSVYNQLYNNYIDFLNKNNLDHILRPERSLSLGSNMFSYKILQKFLP